MSCHDAALLTVQLCMPAPAAVLRDFLDSCQLPVGVPTLAQVLAVPAVLTFQPRHSFWMVMAAACSSPNLSGHSSNSSSRILHW